MGQAARSSAGVVVGKLTVPVHVAGRTETDRRADAMLWCAPLMGNASGGHPRFVLAEPAKSGSSRQDRWRTAKPCPCTGSSEAVVLIRSWLGPSVRAYPHSLSGGSVHPSKNALCIRFRHLGCKKWKFTTLIDKKLNFWCFHCHFTGKKLKGTQLLITDRDRNVMRGCRKAKG
jgi:hypothetical protein